MGASVNEAKIIPDGAPHCFSVNHKTLGICADVVIEKLSALPKCPLTFDCVHGLNFRGPSSRGMDVSPRTGRERETSFIKTKLNHRS